MPANRDWAYPCYCISPGLKAVFLSLADAEDAIRRIVDAPVLYRLYEWQQIFGFFVGEYEFGTPYLTGVLEFGEWPECISLYSYSNNGEYLSGMDKNSASRGDERFQIGDFVEVYLGNRVELGRIRSLPTDIEGLKQRIPDLSSTPYSDYDELCDSYQIDLLYHPELGETGIKSVLLFPIKRIVPLSIRRRFDETNWKSLSCYVQNPDTKGDKISP